MKCLAIVALLVTVAAATLRNPKIIPLVDYFNRLPEGRIISGENAIAGQFPWQAALYTTKPGGTYFCGGTLISNKFILTAGHCADGTTSYRIYLGGTVLSGSQEGRLELQTTRSLLHADYDPWTLQNDIALVELEEPVEFNERIRAIRLPSVGSQVKAGQRLTVSGWGKTSDSSNSVSNDLNFVELDSISNEDCADIYGTQTVIASTVCCRGRPDHSTCNGDSGGPLITLDGDEATHVGVVSFVHVAGCASGNPSGYVRTESYLTWISLNTGININ